MFEMFTKPAVKAIRNAQEEGRSVGYLGSEHILIGLLREEECFASKTLKSFNVSTNMAREVLHRYSPAKETQGDQQEDIPFTPRAKKVCDLAWHAAKELMVNYIGTEHVLLGLVREGDCKGASILKAIGLDLVTLEERLVFLCKQPLEVLIQEIGVAPISE